MSHILIFLHIMLFCICAIALYSTNSLAFEWYSANQRVVKWDTATTMTNGDPLPEGNIIVNKVFLAPDEDKSQKVEIGETPESRYSITLNNEGRYLVGVKSIRNDSNGTKLSETSIVWSDNEEVTVEKFGLVHFFSPMPVKNMQPD